ncbi:MAG: MBL fold metallo-hydrolase, partial [Candidatus Thiodiazotropha sp.]
TPWFVGNMLIEPILTPGHTQGSMCYKIGNNLFTGDVLFAEGCGICKDMSSAYAMFDSIELLKSLTSPETKIFPGHTYAKPVGRSFAELLDYNIYLNFKDRESFAAYRMRGGQQVKRLFDFR